MKSPASPLLGRRLVVAGLIAVAVAVGLTACGSSSSGSTQTAASTGAQATARLNLAKCFRAHGINVPDPSTGGGAAGGGNLFRSLRGYSQAQVTAARQACQQYFAQAFPRLNVSPQQRAQLQQQLVKFAQCMRSHGVNVPDPTFNNNGGAGGAPGAGFGFGGGFRSGQRNSPAFQAASKACQSLRPRFGRGGPGGAGAPGTGGGGTAGSTGD
jgi:hypothetical protein